MTSFFLSIGSNLNSSSVVPECIKRLQNRFHVIRVSPIYETQPVGPAGENCFWNLAVEIQADLDQPALDIALKEIETALGRRRDPKNKYAPRPIDIDILPQEDFQKMPYIIIPLSDIAGHAKDSQTGKTFLELAKPFEQERKNYRIVG